MIPLIVSGTPFKVEISPLEHLLLTWLMTFQTRGLVQDGQKVCGWYVWGEARVKSPFLLDVHSTVF
jgi:hypothetical protein